MNDDTNIIDSHANIGWDVSNLRKNQTPAEQSYFELLEKMGKNGVEKAILVPFPSPKSQFNPSASWYDLENEYIITSATSSKKFVPFLGINPNDEQCLKNVRTLASLFPVKGVKLSHQDIINFSIEKLINHPVMKIIQDNSLIFMIHIGTGREEESYKYHSTLDYAIEVAEKYPDVTFIFAHLGRLHENMTDALKMENVFMDTSGLSLEPRKAFVALDKDEKFSSFSSNRIIEKLVDLGFGKKIVWGSDEPYTHYKDELSYVNDAEITQSNKRAIFYENIAKLLGLK